MQKNKHTKLTRATFLFFCTGISQPFRFTVWLGIIQCFCTDMANIPVELAHPKVLENKTLFHISLLMYILYMMYLIYIIYAMTTPGFNLQFLVGKSHVLYYWGPEEADLRSALLQRQRRSCRQTDNQKASRANPSSQYLDRPAQPISSKMGAQQLSIGQWSRLGFTAFPLGRLEETGNRLQETQDGRWRWNTEECCRENGKW